MYLWTGNNGYWLVPFAIFTFRENIHSFQKQKKNYESLDVSHSCLTIRKSSCDSCYVPVMDSIHSTVGDTCLFIYDSLYDGVSERCLSLKVAISLLALWFSVSLFKKIKLSLIHLWMSTFLTALKFNGNSACLSIELDLSLHWWFMNSWFFFFFLTKWNIPSW